ncbi:hypothetical protein [Shewanella sp. UCD-KL21]|uniref:hypothetical protein n=1 Tax=Shewanella sp. UCD-KL21 TaxID=1917164 RepID=UPI0009705436|nr:hypothetical protein [Shewanella sp. UCD-KL21]
MYKLDNTTNSIESTLDDAQDLFIAISTLLESPRTDDVLVSIKALMDLLGEDLQTLQQLNLLQNQDLGGMGDAPMLSAVELSPC